jgi:hypothetical protein
MCLLKPKTFCEFFYSYAAHVVLLQVFWGMRIVPRYQFCFVLQVICFHLWLDFSLYFKVN